MANRYLIGSGAFTSTSIWSTTYNGSGGASVPVSGDIIQVDADHDITSGLPSDDTFDFIVYLGNNSANSVTLGLSGSPTFRSLIIQSKNSAAHTVNFDSDFTVNKFIALGSNASNRLSFTSTRANIAGPGSPTASNMIIGDYGTIYADFIDFTGGEGTGRLYSTIVVGNPLVKLYGGSNSITVSSQYWLFEPWLLQDPPKISTLVDPLTTAPGSNDNWTVEGTVTQVSTGHGGGGYDLATDGGPA